MTIAIVQGAEGVCELFIVVITKYNEKFAYTFGTLYLNIFAYNHLIFESL